MDKDIYYKRLNNLRGIFAIEIVIGHVVRSENTILFLLGKFMIISVAFFFFVSGFSLVRSYEMKEGYLDKFLFNKLSYLFVISTFALGINTLVDSICQSNLGYYPPGDNVVLWFMKSTNWYLFELAFFYICFFLLFKHVKRYAIFMLSLLVLVLITVLFFSGWTEMWYASAMGFPMGIAFGRYYDRIVCFLETIWGKLFTLCLVFLGLASQLLSSASLIGMVYLRNIMCIAGLLVLSYFVFRCDIENKVSRFLTAHSLEIYLFQFVWLELTESSGMNWKFRVFIVPVCTIFTAVVTHPFLEKLKIRR